MKNTIDWKGLSTRKKLKYIWDYYKLPLFACLILLYIAIYTGYRIITHRDMLLYAAAVNITDSKELKARLKDDFLSSIGYDKKHEDMTLYTRLYLTTDKDSEYYTYSYASEMKLIGALEAKRLDVVLMDRESFDAFCANGYLCEIDSFLKKNCPDFYEEHKDDLVKNTIILSDNADEVSRDKSIEYKAETKDALLGLSMSQSGFYKDLGFSDEMLLGVIKDTAREGAASKYVEFLYITCAYDEE